MGFAERMGLVPEKAVQIDQMDVALKNRLWNCLREFIYEDSENTETIANSILDGIGEKNGFESYIAVEEIEKNVDKGEWYVLYDMIESAIRAKQCYKEYDWYDSDPYAYAIEVSNNKSVIHSFIEEINEILEKEKSGYRLYEPKGEFIKVFDKEEFQAIQEAATSPFDSVDQHISKALSLYSSRENPDYENAIKESISAVEAMCSIITGETGSNASLGKMLKKLEDNGIDIHSSLKAAFSQLYASDTTGIRHGGIKFNHVSEEDAKYMLVICSAFVNYLKVKYSKITA